MFDPLNARSAGIGDSSLIRPKDLVEIFLWPKGSFRLDFHIPALHAFKAEKLANCPLKHS